MKQRSRLRILWLWFYDSMVELWYRGLDRVNRFRAWADRLGETDELDSSSAHEEDFRPFPSLGMSPIDEVTGNDAFFIPR